jgi:hypothetical protein
LVQHKQLAVGLETQNHRALISHLHAHFKRNRMVYACSSVGNPLNYFEQIFLRRVRLLR